MRFWALALVGFVACAKPVGTTAPVPKTEAAVSEMRLPEPACAIELGEPAVLLGVSIRSVEGAPLVRRTPQLAQFEGPSGEHCDAVVDKASLIRIPADSSRSLESIHSQFTEALEWHGLTVGEAEQRIADEGSWHVAYYNRAATPPALLYVAATRLPGVGAVFVSVYSASGPSLRPMMTAFERSALSLASP